MAGRLTPISPESMSQAQQVLYHALVNSSRSKDPGFPLVSVNGSLLGPFNALLLSPSIGMALQEVGSALRHTEALSPREREITILTVAASWGCEFERTTHERIGGELGLTADELLSLHLGDIPKLTNARETTCALLARAMTRASGRVSDADWNSWVAQVGIVAVFELSIIVGYYSILALQMRVFDVR